MKEHPILFSTLMVQAILDDLKTVTRREATTGNRYQKWSVGDLLWVRESWQWEGDTKWSDAKPMGDFWYKADIGRTIEQGPAKWRPSIHMPRQAARILLEITNISIEKLHSITEEDAIKEGISMGEHADKILTAKDCFEVLWHSINGKESWDRNPDVYRI